MGSEYVFGVELGIDDELLRDEDGRAAGIAHPGRLAPTTAACFVALSAALIRLDGRRHLSRAARGA